MLRNQLREKVSGKMDAVKNGSLNDALGQDVPQEITGKIDVVEASDHQALLPNV